MLLVATLLAHIAGLAGGHTSTPTHPGVVSYTYRDYFQKDVPGTLDRIKALGIRDIEFSNLSGV